VSAGEVPPVRGTYLRDLVLTDDPTAVYLADWARILCLVLAAIVAAEVLRWSPRGFASERPRYWARVGGTAALVASAAAAQYILLHRPVTVLLPVTLAGLVLLGYGLAGVDTTPRPSTRAALEKLEGRDGG
jgi:hypothetical protein